MKANVQAKVLPSTARTLKSKAAFHGLTTSELAEAMFLYCLNNDELFKQLISDCQAAKEITKQAA